MKIKCSKEKLLEGISITKKAISRSNIIDNITLQTILLSAKDNIIKLSSTNLNIFVDYKFEGEVEKEGAIAIPAEIFHEIVSNLSDETIEIEASKSKTIIITKQNNIKINSFSADDFINPLEIEKQFSIKMKSLTIKDALDKTIISVSNQTFQPELKGIYFSIDNEGICFVGTDIHRLSEKIIPAELNRNNNVIIPLDTAVFLSNIIKNQEDIRIIIGSENKICFETDTIKVVCRLIEGEYPNYKLHIPTEHNTIVNVNRLELINRLKLASIFSSKINDVQLLIGDKTIEIHSQSENKGENTSNIEADVEGKDVKLTFNCYQLIEGLESISTDKVNIKILEKKRPIIVSPIGNDNYRYIIMPLNKE